MNLEDPRLETARQLIKEWCDENHDFSFNTRDPIVRLHEPTFGGDEINAALDVMLSTFVTMGEKSHQFEQRFADRHGVKHGIMVNSGSSANLLAIASLANKQYSHYLQPGDEIIVPALSWSTTVWPVIQLGLVPVIVDIDPATLNIAPNEIERAIGPKTRGIMPVHVYGNPCDMQPITGLCKQHNLILIEDCCEALGAEYDNQPVGSFGAVGTFSFYYSHHITTLEGGLCITDDMELAEMMRILRAHGWVRETHQHKAYESQYPDIDPKFLFVNLGYNLRATELQGTIGNVQLPRLPALVKARRKNAAQWREELAPWSEYFDIQQETAHGKSSWFGLPITVRIDAPFAATHLRQHLACRNIESRPIICGNIARQPAMQWYEHRVAGNMQHADHVMRNGFTFGNHHAIDQAAHDYVNQALSDFFSDRGLT